MPGKMARSDPRPPCGLPEVLVAVRTSRLPSRNAGKAPIFTPVPGHPANPGSQVSGARVRYLFADGPGRTASESPSVDRRHALFPWDRGRLGGSL